MNNALQNSLSALVVFLGLKTIPLQSIPFWGALLCIVGFVVLCYYIGKANQAIKDRKKASKKRWDGIGS